MNSFSRMTRSGVLKLALVLSGVALVAACSSGSPRPKPADLGADPGLISVRGAWTNRVGAISYPLQVNVSGSTLTLAASDGTVAAIDARNGSDLWRVNVGAAVVAGAGSDGFEAAVITSNNEVVAIEAGKILWKQKLPAQGYTAPLVAGKRVFVLTADRSVTAFDGRTGARLWGQQRTGEPLVLRQAGLLMAYEDTLVVGISGRLVGMNPSNGTSRWEAPIAVARGVNDIERLIDLVGTVARDGNIICARSFGASVGCVNADAGTVLWNKPANGTEGVAGDDRSVFGTESDGKVLAWRRTDGERVWQSERLLYRTLTAPLVLGRSVVIGDSTGIVHLLSREDGTPLARLSTDSSGVAATPVTASGTLVVVSKSGAVYGFLPN